MQACFGNPSGCCKESTVSELAHCSLPQGLALAIVESAVHTEYNRIVIVAADC